MWTAETPPTLDQRPLRRPRTAHIRGIMSERGRLGARLRLAALVFVPLVGIGALVARKLEPIALTVTPVVRGVAVDAVYATGTVEADDRVNVKAKTSGS